MNRAPTIETESELFTQLERLAAHCPWQKCDIWSCREPEGQIRFTAYVSGDEVIGLENGSASGGETPTEVVERYIQEHPQTDPNVHRLQKIAELRMEISRLERVELSLPPFRPCPQIGAGSPEREPQRTPASEIMVNVESQVQP